MLIAINIIATKMLAKGINDNMKKTLQYRITEL